MAQRFFCDRCDKEIKPVNTMYLFHTTERHKIVFFKDNISVYNIKWSLCQECADKFIEWFNHPEQEERT